jgi:hypothetical protein
MASPTSPTEPATEAFPALSPIDSVPGRGQQPASIQTSQRPPSSSNAGTTINTSSPTRSRTASLRQSFMNSNPPLGMWQATGEVTSKVPSLAEIKNGSFTTDGWSHEGQMERRGANPHDIHRRRIARTSSASTRTRKSSITGAAVIDESIPERPSEDQGREYFPRRGSLAYQEPVEEEPTTKEGAPVDERPQEPNVTSGAMYVHPLPFLLHH